MASSVGSVTHSEKFTLPSPSVSYRLQASSVLLPLTLISSQFQVTWSEVGKLASSTQSWVRSFCPGSSFGPAVSTTQVCTSTGCPSGAAAALRRVLVVGVRTSATNNNTGRKIFLMAFSFARAPGGLRSMNKFASHLLYGDFTEKQHRSFQRALNDRYKTQNMNSLHKVNLWSSICSFAPP